MSNINTQRFPELTQEQLNSFIEDIKCEAGNLASKHKISALSSAKLFDVYSALEDAIQNEYDKAKNHTPIDQNDKTLD